ncbi:MAG TPA: hypothetical protein PK228_14470 [Saprospiraceae bacterium]|nr:hypothetical protein [Saprospiraceae bacterium]
MTQLMLEIRNQSDLDALIPLLHRLHIKFSKLDTRDKQAEEIAEAIRIVRQGCDMNNFGDALEYQRESRKVINPIP